MPDNVQAVQEKVEEAGGFKLLINTAGLLKKNVDRYAETMTLEMGKPIREARGEVNKCAWPTSFKSK